MIFRRLILLMQLFLTACMPSTPADVSTRAASAVSDMPPMKTFSTPRPEPARRANSDIARDFLDLAFRLESGRDLPVLTRFEGPIRVRVTGAAPASLPSDLARLIYRFQTEAGIDIALSRSNRANITIEAVSRAEIRRFLPQAACFVVPNVDSLAEYGRARRSARVNWANLRTREKLAIFLPNDASPQEVRDCLHEELAQAIGPLNDLYRLPDSVFNDDNVHTVLTGFDMLILRLHYAPELRSGMRRAEVAQRLPAILDRINPGGNGVSPTRLRPTPRPWIEAVQTALGPGFTPGERRQGAQEALQIATALGWTDHRRGFSHFAMGRILQSSDPKAARDQFLTADRYFANVPGTRLHRAYVASQLAAFALQQGDGEGALALVVPHLSTAEQYENAALLSTLMLLRAEGLQLVGRGAEANAVRLDSVGWARYGFGAEWAVRAKMREISALSPYRGNPGGAL